MIGFSWKITSKREWNRRGTYFSESIYPFRNWFPSQLMTDVLAEMITVLDDEVICITMVARRALLHELSDFMTIEAGRANQYWPPEFEAGALSRFNFKNATGWIVMSSKCIFYTMDCTMHTFYSQKGIKCITNFLNSDQRWSCKISLWHYLLHQSERYQGLPNRHNHSSGLNRTHLDRPAFCLDNI